VLGQYSQAIAHRERTLEMYRALGNQYRVATTLSNMGEIARLQGDYAQAVAPAAGSPGPGREDR
jgi:hypothetical protein